jgi:hypothetical protein
MVTMMATVMMIMIMMVMIMMVMVMMTMMVMVEVIMMMMMMCLRSRKFCCNRSPVADHQNHYSFFEFGEEGEGDTSAGDMEMDLKARFGSTLILISVRSLMIHHSILVTKTMMEMEVVMTMMMMMNYPKVLMKAQITLIGLDVITLCLNVDKICVLSLDSPEI